MQTFKLELSVKILLGAIALGLFLNAFNDFPPKAYADKVQEVKVVNEIRGRVKICDEDDYTECAGLWLDELKVDAD